jgi:hypothetical protein
MSNKSLKIQVNYSRSPLYLVLKLEKLASSAQRRLEILNWVSAILYGDHHSSAKEGLLEGTGEWLLQKEEFRNWKASQQSTILWLHGIRESASLLVVPCLDSDNVLIAGAGKTKLVYASTEEAVH